MLHKGHYVTTAHEGHVITNLLHDNGMHFLGDGDLYGHYTISWETMASHGHESHSFFKSRVKLSYGC